MTDPNNPSRGTIVLAVVAVLAVAGLAGSFILSLAPASTELTLAAMEADVAHRFPIVTHLPSAELKAKLASSNPPVLIDVREDAQYSVSHLDGAIRMSPDIPIATAKAELQPLVAGREVVFYDASGMYASVLATEVQDELIKSGAIAVYNLKGGIFGWHDGQGALVDGQGVTDDVHPVSDQWAKILRRSDKLRFTPRPTPTSAP